MFLYLYTFKHKIHKRELQNVVLLVASIPMAVEIVTTTTLALGSKELSHEGAIVTILAAVEWRGFTPAAGYDYGYIWGGYNIYADFRQDFNRKDHNFGSRAI